MTWRQLAADACLGVAIVAAGYLVWRIAMWIYDRWRDGRDDWDGWVEPVGGVGQETITDLAPADLGPDDEWDDDTLASLHGEPAEWEPPAYAAEHAARWVAEHEPPTDERLERVVLALIETPEQWRARVEQEDYEWRARVQSLCDGSVDFGAPLELAGA